ncbi:uncharacterized protein DNG_00050 [Cephalotrichum gorgonifer]|uniref:Uncharacterized protein n=1 Tax=Cephalotrichum gorgonifer TaxID=2041049 RepID=A0AAE8SQT1_9PEZI|nr:uncharacterized protein DNG_00050 [Cephalotrichum gorgonifer]
MGSAATGVDPAPGATSTQPCDDTGALVIHRVQKAADHLSFHALLSGIGEAPELSATQSEFHPAFELRFLPETISPFARSLLEVDIEADAKYAGWSPGSTSLSGFCQDLTLWRNLHNLGPKAEPTWERTGDVVALSTAFVLERWNAIAKNGLGEDWTEQKGYDAVRQTCGPSDHPFLDQKETIRIRHQISDLLAVLGTSPVPSIEMIPSISVLANIEQIDPSAGWGLTDFLFYMLLAREATLRMARSKRRWHGGVTTRVVLAQALAELWSKSMVFTGTDTTFRFEPDRTVKERQMDGIVKFAEEMQWPFLAEIKETARRLLSPQEDTSALDTLTWDWFSGLVMPGARFQLTTLTTLYGLSPSLSLHPPASTVKIRKGTYGIVYPQGSYWNSRSIIGKVLGPLSLLPDGETAMGRKVKCLGGWVGPYPAPVLPESTFGLLVELQTSPPPWVSEDTSAGDDSGAGSKWGNDSGWELPTPPPPSTETVIAQTLRLTKVVATEPAGNDAPSVYQASLDFRLGNDNKIVTSTLNVNSVFLAAMACRGGPHRIDPRAAAKYTFRTLGIGDLPGAKQDGGATALTVINATRGPAAEAFARAWCSEKGTNAVVWKEGHGCCFKCALMMVGRDGVGVGVLIMT